MDDYSDVVMTGGQDCDPNGELKVAERLNGSVVAPTGKLNGSEQDLIGNTGCLEKWPP